MCYPSGLGARRGDTMTREQQLEAENARLHAGERDGAPLLTFVLAGGERDA